MPRKDIFNNQGWDRKGSCYTIRKANPSYHIHPSDSIFIPFNAAGNLDQIAKLFNSCEKFYSYDTYTFLSVQAAMCGCVSIVVPDPNIPLDTWLKGSRLNQYGIAYGEDDIPRALETLPQLRQEIEKIEIEMNNQITKFVQHCNNKFN
jgi:hypothetical protein